MDARHAVGTVGAALVLTLSLTAGTAVAGGTGPTGASTRPDDTAPPCWGSAASEEARGTQGPRAVMMRISEVDYLTAMIPHHEEAVAAARQLARSDRPRMRELGASIVAVQQAEIDQMTTWLSRWYPDAVPAPDARPMMRDLTDLEGDALDAAFLADMIPHHMMAVAMSQHLLRSGGLHPDVATFAAQVRDSQRDEITVMHRLLREMDLADPTVRGHGRGRHGHHR